ncbi:MAG: hypothetical protein HC887_13425 [Desulfobacteraceae bacterium]|nr:hypothetical protein [Desulfobacteraceae bacterium]
MGSGTVSLILDIAGILEKAGIRDLETEEESMLRSEDEKEIQTFLLFDNGTQEQFALPLELISRIERINISQIERIRDKLFLQYQQQKLRLVFFGRVSACQSSESLAR